MCRLSRNLGALTSWNPVGLFRAVMGELNLLSYDFCTGYLQLYTWNNRFLYGTHSCGCSVVTVYGKCTEIPLDNVLYFYISTSRIICAVPSMAVLCSALIWCYAGMLLRYCLSDFEMVSVAPVITGTAFVSYILHVLYLYCKFLIFYNIPGFFLYHTSYTFLFHYHGLWLPVCC